MSAHDTLAAIVEEEARKLLDLSKGALTPLSPDHLSALEILARCAKALKATVPEPEDDATAGLSREELARIAEG